MFHVTASVLEPHGALASSLASDYRGTTVSQRLYQHTVGAEDGRRSLNCVICRLTVDVALRPTDLRASNQILCEAGLGTHKSPRNPFRSLVRVASTSCDRVILRRFNSRTDPIPPGPTVSCLAITTGRRDFF